jgi:acetolactate synthase small subunit
MSTLPPAVFHVTACADPGLLPRLLALFAKRGLIPDSLRAECDRTQEILSIALSLAILSDQVAEHIALCMAQIPGVTGVTRC